MITLRPNQKEAVEKAIHYFREDEPTPALMVLPTAWGKSILAAEVAAACPEPILVVQPTKELLEQNLSKYRQLCGTLAPAGIYSASFGKRQIDHVTFATIGSIKSLGAQFRALGFRKMLIDEAHLYPRKEQSMLGEFLRDSGIRQVLGITATPLKLESFSEKQGEKFDKWSELVMLTNPSPSGTFFKRILHVGQIQEMTALGYWSPLRYEVLPFDRHLLVMTSTGTDYTEDSIVSAYVANNVRQNIIAAIDYHSERRHILAFVPSVEEAQQLATLVPGSAYVSGEMPKKERAEIIKGFRSGQIRTVFNCQILSTGFDYPEIDMIITGYSTASVAKHYQVIGRGVRVHPDKRSCVVVDAGGNVERFGRVEDIRFEYDRRWRMFGTDGVLLTGIPIGGIGAFTRDDVLRLRQGSYGYPVMNFGKHKGKRLDQIPCGYLQWLAGSGQAEGNFFLRTEILRALENYVRDTTAEPPVSTLPDGQHAGEHMAFVPKGYLRWYYNSKEWNETNDSLRRGIEYFLHYSNNQPIQG